MLEYSGEFTIKGNTPSKKNSRRSFVKNGRMINIPSERYEQWHELASWQLKALKIPKLRPPYEISMTFYFKDRRRKDLDNAQSSVLDLLQDCEVIEDDDAKLLTHIESWYGGVDKDNPRVEVQIRSGD